MEEFKQKLIFSARLILKILLASLILSICLYLFFCVLSHFLKDLKTNYLLWFIIALSFCVLAYLFYHSHQLKQHYIALNCSNKLTGEEYEKMIKTMTRSEVNKLERSAGYREYLVKKPLSNPRISAREEKDSDIEFSSESEKNE